MKIFFDNVDFSSTTGPNSFASKLKNSLEVGGHNITNEKPDIQLSFITASQKIGPIVQRLDGIYFNSEQDWKALNYPIHETYKIASGVIFQSEFNKALTEKYFGKKAEAFFM